MTSDSAPDMTVEPAEAHSIVVGHDGSKGADAALRCALELAADLAAPVTIVRAWSIATAPRPPGWTFGYVSSSDELSEAVHDELVAKTKDLVASFPAVQASYRTYQSGAARSLIEASRGARMLVVGSRGLGGFAEMVLGSVSDQCVRHAACPVLVTKGP